MTNIELTDEEIDTLKNDTKSKLEHWDTTAQIAIGDACKEACINEVRTREDILKKLGTKGSKAVPRD